MKNRVSAALGTFDGLHAAHRTILQNALKFNNSVCITFKLPPKSRGFIMQPQLKEKKLQDLGFKTTVMLDFEEVKNMPPLEFLEFITNTYKITDFFVGYDYRFGKGGEGDVNLLREFCEKKGLHLNVQEPIKINGELVSSTAIRRFLKEGNIAKAIEFLGHNLEIEGKVLHGDARGRCFGFPTINQSLPQNMTELKFGVYSSLVEISGKTYKAITDIGTRPTYPLNKPISETHILDFEGDLYEKTLTLTLCDYMREEKKFSSADKLMEQISQDIQTRKGE